MLEPAIYCYFVLVIFKKDLKELKICRTLARLISVIHGTASWQQYTQGKSIYRIIQGLSPNLSSIIKRTKGNRLTPFLPEIDRKSLVLWMGKRSYSIEFD